LIKLETTTEKGNKVLACTIAKKFPITIDELVSYAKNLNIKIKSAQHILTLDEANQLAQYVQNQKQKLYFNSSEWFSCSTVEEYQNLIIFLDNTMSIIDSQIKQNGDILANSNNIYRELQVLNMNNQDLEEIKIYLLSKFDFSLENLKDKLIYMKSEALEYLDEVDSSLSIWSDKKLSQKDINFNFTATKVIRLYEEQMKKINNYSTVDKFFSKLFTSLKSLQETDDKFQTTDKEKLTTILKDGYLEECHNTLYIEWTKEINKLNKFYIKFIKAYFIGKISENMVLEIFSILDSIKQDLEEFYLTVRSGLVTEYKDNPKNELIQEIATKDRIFKIYRKSQIKFIELLKNETSQIAYRFLNTILSELLDFKIEEKSEGYEEIYEKMIELHSLNLEIYLNDIVTYGKELEKRDMEISKLMFKMQTDLEKTGE